MSKLRKEEFHPKRSDFVQAVHNFIQLCKDDGRDWQDEVEEAVYEAAVNSGVK